MRSHHALLVVPLWLCGCHAPELAAAVPWLVVEPTVRFDALHVGEAQLLEVEVQNTGTAAAQVKLTVSEPFQIPTYELRLAPGATGAVTLQLTPQSYTLVEGLLALDDGQQVVEVQLTAHITTDADGDGYEAIGAGGTDCDDLNELVNPSLPERCDGLDTDCDGATDNLEVLPQWWPDADTDSFGDSQAEAVSSCEQPPHTVSNNLDCDDSTDQAYPGGQEVWYDGVDGDCSGGSDFDQDGDGEDTAAHGGADCEDTEPTIYSGAPEVDDGLDQDCDDLIDEDFVEAGSLLFTEIMLWPAAVDVSVGRWLEIRNPTDGHVTTADLIYQSNVDELDLGALPAIAPGQVLVLCMVEDLTVNGGVSCDGALPISPGTSTIRLLWRGDLLDEVDLQGWALPTGASLELGIQEQEAQANDLPSSWCEGVIAFGEGDKGTPGAVLPPC